MQGGAPVMDVSAAGLMDMAEDVEARAEGR